MTRSAMAVPNTLDGLSRDFTAAGIEPGMVLMVHSALSRVGWTVGGAATVIRALLDVLGPEGTLVMPAESPFLSDPAFWRDERIPEAWHETIRANLPLFDPRITPTTMGAVPEAFRTYPGTLRSNHPLVSVCANGRDAARIVSEHALEFGEGPGTPCTN